MAFSEPERIETVVIGGGQAGLSVGYYLAQRGLPFVILDANERLGDAWRNRWDSLRLFTPRRFDGLMGGAISWTNRLVSLKGRGRRLPGILRGAVRTTSSNRSQSAQLDQER